MLTDIFFLVVGTILNAFAALLSNIGFIVPPQIQAALVYFLGFMNYWGGVVDLPVFYAVVISLIAFEVAYWTFKLVLVIIHITPWVGNPRTPKTNE